MAQKSCLAGKGSGSFLILLLTGPLSEEKVYYWENITAATGDGKYADTHNLVILSELNESKDLRTEYLLSRPDSA